MTPTARSLALLRRQGFIACPVERWVPGANVRRDVWGFGDILAAHPRDGIVLLVQATTADHVAHRLDKARHCPELRLWLKAGGAFEVWGWARRGGRWQVRRVAVAVEDLAAIVLAAPSTRRRHRGERQGELFGDG